MSDNRSWKALSQSNTEIAIETVRRCVVALRSRGLKTDTALRDLAPELGVTHRRIRTLFHRDGIPVVLKSEWMSLRYRAGLFFLNEAARLRELADQYEEKVTNWCPARRSFHGTYQRLACTSVPPDC